MRRIFLSLLIVFVLSGFVWAEGLEGLAQNFSPLSALVINVEKDTVLIDKGEKDGVRRGDLFTIYQEGQKIIHPVTKREIGRLKEPLAKAEAIRVEETFSVLRILEKKGEPKVGQPAVRFADIRVLLLEDPPGSAQQVLPSLRAALSEAEFVNLPGVSWRDLNPSFLSREDIDLVLVADTNGLRVYNQALELLNAYTWPLGRQTPAPPPAPRVSAPPAPQAPPSGPYPYSTLRYQMPAAPQFRRVAKIPAVIVDFEMGDIDNDGRPEVVYMTPNGLFVSQFGGRILATYKHTGFGKMVNFSLGPDGWIALNVYVPGEAMRSKLLRFREGRLETAVSDINFFLAFFDLNGDGLKETLLGQAYDRESLFGPTVYRLKPGWDKISYLETEKVPGGFRVLLAAFADINGNRVREACFMDLGHKLRIYERGRKVWTSNTKVGGSIYTVAASSSMKKAFYKQTISAEVEPLVRDLNGDGRQEVILVRNVSSHRDILPNLPSYESGEVICLIYTATGYELIPLTGRLEAPIQGIAIWGKELYCVVVKGNPLTQEGESYLLAFPLVAPTTRGTASGPPQGTPLSP
ncbi:hypothetical protein [Thermosulfuriphilus sp.]